MHKILIGSLTAIAFISSINFAVAGSSAQVNATATVTGDASINITQAAPSFPSSTINQIIAGNGGSVPASGIVMYNDANPTNGYNITITSSNVNGSGNPVLQNSLGASSGQIPFTISITSCGTGTAITFPSGYGSASSSVTGNNATSYACSQSAGQISYTLGTPTGAISAGSYSDQLTFNIQQQ